jgi:signal transduction histidine kinase
VHHPTLDAVAGTAGFLDLAGRLADAAGRESATDGLARLLGGERLLLFAPDPELGVLLPAPGLPQVLPRAGEWRTFLDACARDGACAGSVPGEEGSTLPALGSALPDGTCAVLVSPSAGASGPGALLPLLPLLGALFRAERQAASDAFRIRSASDAVARAQALTAALQQMRARLEDALVQATDASTLARARAHEAESLTVELQAQAEQLEEQATELETLNLELTERTAEAEDARAAADAANRAKSEFLANMSHELRTPINAVIGYTQLLAMGVTGTVTEEQRAQLERIRVSGEHLLGLVNDVLDLAKVEAGQMTFEYERDTVMAVVAEAVALVQVQAADRQLTLANECRDPAVTYVGDRDRVRQILLNMLSNAVKFTEAGGRVTVRGAHSRPAPPAQLTGDGVWACISVEDTGIGMDDEALAKIFQPFVQAESGHTRTRGGTGLGLTISRQLARLMHGDLTVRSEKGAGSTFTLWLPAAQPMVDGTWPHAGEPLHRRQQGLVLLAEAEAHLPRPVARVRVRSWSRGRRRPPPRAPGASRTPRRPRSRTPRRRTSRSTPPPAGDAEPRPLQRGEEQVQPRLVVRPQRIVVLRRQRQRERARRLQRRRRAHREEVVNLADRGRQVRRRDAPSHAPPRHRVRLGQRVDHHGALAHPVELRHADVPRRRAVRMRVEDVLVDLVGDAEHVVLWQSAAICSSSPRVNTFPPGCWGCTG